MYVIRGNWKKFLFDVAELSRNELRLELGRAEVKV